MYLSKLELTGFKSFATRTVLFFDPGITAIVGPNGCGKSNIVDAVRWVIGEQRARILRSEKMENVIFNGTTKRRPLGMAEVLLTVENTRGVLPTEYSEVTLGRRLYRSGESEYLLNGTPCRLRDIVDLFMDTGMGAGAYSVIELKMIEEILSDNAQDRRHLFEEAAGITKYKQRRAQTLRKLDATQADLTRLRDLTDEIEQRVNSLKRQAARTARFQEYETERRQLELTLAQADYDRLKRQQGALQTETRQLHDTLEEHTARLAGDEAGREALRKTLVDREQDLSEQQQRLSAHLTAVRDLEADLRLEQERLAGARRERERATDEQEDADAQRVVLEEEAGRLEAACAQAAPVREQSDHVLREAERARDEARNSAEDCRETLQNLRRREQLLAEERAAHLRRLDRLTNRLELLDREQQRLLEQQKELGEEYREQEQSTEQAGLRMADSTEHVASARQALHAVEEAYEAHRRSLEEAGEKLHRLERTYEAAQAEANLLESLVSSFDAFPDAVQFLAEHPTWTAEAPRTVADVLACAPEHRPALDAALGALAACLIVATDEAARQAAALLRSQQKGRATFLVLDRLPEATAANDEAAGGAVPLHRFVHTGDPAYAPVVALLLRDWFVSPSLEQARAQAAVAGRAARYVTAAGEWVDARGLIHAGGEQDPASPLTSRLHRRDQLDAAREHRAAAARSVEEDTATVEALREVLESLPLEDRRHTLEQAEQSQREAEHERDRTAYELAALERRRAEMADRLGTLDAERAGLQAETEPLRTAAAQAEEQTDALRADREAAEAAFLTAETEHRAAQERYREAHVAAVEARNRHEMLEHDLARTRDALAALAARAVQRRAHLAALQETIDASHDRNELLQRQLAEVRTDRSSLEEAVSRAKTALLQTKVDIDKVEVRLRKLRQAREETIHEENVRAVRQAEIQTRMEDLLAGIEETFGRSLIDEPVAVPDAFDAAAAREEVQALRNKIKNLGSINPLALDEYETERARFDFMAAQRDDLERAEATLLETIDEINATAAARFAHTYEAIRTSFQRLFGELFGTDASADLVLTDADDPLESAIDIVAKPRGKRPIGIAQLSSGEKTLTAIALLFAIYLVKPSPFCILDEVDAPLDDANVDRFMRLIRRFADDTQFILVTHNKRTMKLADRLYGITMQEQGVSQLVGVKFEDALALAG